MSQKKPSVPETSNPRPHLAGESPRRTLFRMTWPMIFGVVALMGYQLVDSIYISMLGTDPLAALGFTVAVNQLSIGIQVGMGIAATALISRAIGAKNTGRARRLGGIVLIAGASIMGLLCITTWLVRDVILDLLDADPYLWPLVSQYWGPWLLSIWLGALLYFAYSIARAQGNTHLPGSVMVLTSLLNVVLDPVFIFAFGWGLPGAAWATSTSFLIGGIIMWHHIKRRKWVTYHQLLAALRPALRDLGIISGPAMVSQLMPGIAAMAATRIVAGFGAGAVAAWGLVTRLEFFSIVVVLALTMSLPPMVGRHIGAANYGDTDRLVRLAVRFTLLFQAGIAIIGLGLAFPLPAALSDDPQVIAYLRTWFILVPASYGALGTCMIMVSVANAMGMPLRAVIISLLRLFAFYLPAVWLGAQAAGMTGVFTGVLLGNLAAGLVAWLIYRNTMKEVMDHAQTPEATP